MTEQVLPFDTRDSQAEKILRAMQNGRKLTCLDILRDFQCMNAKGRIHELRKVHKIQDEWVQVNSGKRVKRYFL